MTGWGRHLRETDRQTETGRQADRDPGFDSRFLRSGTTHVKRSLTRRKQHKEWISADTIHKLETRGERKTVLNNSRTRAAKAKAQEEYTSADREVKRRIRKDKRDYIDDLARQAETTAGQGNLRDLYLVTKKLTGKFQQTDKLEKDKNGNPMNSLNDGQNISGTAEPPHPWLTTRHPVRRDKTAHRLWQTLKGRSQEGHHDPEEWEGCRTRRDTSRRDQSRHRDGCQHAIQLSSARSGRRRYRLSGKKEPSSCCQKRETLGTAATIEGSYSC